MSDYEATSYIIKNFLVTGTEDSPQTVLYSSLTDATGEVLPASLPTIYLPSVSAQEAIVKEITVQNATLTGFTIFGSNVGWTEDLYCDLEIKFYKKKVKAVAFEVKNHYVFLLVTMTCASTGVDIYYTLDGTDPTTASTLYIGTITLTQGYVVKARAIEPVFGDLGPVSSADLTTGTIPPVYNPDPPTGVDVEEEIPDAPIGIGVNFGPVSSADLTTGTIPPVYNPDPPTGVDVEEEIPDAPIGIGVN